MGRGAPDRHAELGIGAPGACNMALARHEYNKVVVVVNWPINSFMEDEGDIGC